MKLLNLPGKLLLVFLVLLLFTGYSCKKEELTTATQVGANTFSCKVNGKIQIPNNEAFSVDAMSTSLYLNEDTNFYNLKILTNYSKSDPNKKIYITIYKINTSGMYAFSSKALRYGEYLTDYPDKKEYNSRTFNNGEINIMKLDIPNRIVSGTFWFEASNILNPEDKVNITDGRFDLRF